MIQVFCARRGSGKTKRLIELANNQMVDAKGDSVYIDDDSRPMLQLSRGIRFIDTNEYYVKDCQSFYGMLCGIISSLLDKQTGLILTFILILMLIQVKKYQNVLKNM